MWILCELLKSFLSKLHVIYFETPHKDDNSVGGLAFCLLFLSNIATRVSRPFSSCEMVMSMAASLAARKGQKSKLRTTERPPWHNLQWVTDSPWWRFTYRVFYNSPSSYISADAVHSMVILYVLVILAQCDWHNKGVYFGDSWSRKVSKIKLQTII